MTAPASVPRGSFHSVSQRRAWRRAGHLKERVLAVTGRGPRVGRRRPVRRLPLRAPSTRQVPRRTTPKGVRRAGTVDGFSHTSSSCFPWSIPSAVDACGKVQASTEGHVQDVMYRWVKSRLLWIRRAPACVWARTREVGMWQTSSANGSCFLSDGVLTGRQAVSPTCFSRLVQWPLPRMGSAAPQDGISRFFKAGSPREGSAASPDCVKGLPCLRRAGGATGSVQV